MCLDFLELVVHPYSSAPAVIPILHGAKIVSDAMMFQKFHAAQRCDVIGKGGPHWEVMAVIYARVIRF
jgi:hypothetical protein